MLRTFALLTYSVVVVVDRFILEPLIMRNDLYSFSFYKNMLDKMKSQKDALKPDDDETNIVSFVFHFPPPPPHTHTHTTD
jgi:hypothetical protein